MSIPIAIGRTEQHSSMLTQGKYAVASGDHEIEMVASAAPMLSSRDFRYHTLAESREPWNLLCPVRTQGQPFLRFSHLQVFFLFPLFCKL